MKKSIIILLVVMLMLTGCSEKKDSFEVGEDIFFDTKEECILSFFQTITEGDMTKVYQHYALNSKTEGYDAQKYYEDLGEILQYKQAFPAYTDMYDEMGYVKNLGNINHYLDHFIYSIQFSEEGYYIFKDSVTVPYDDYEWYMDEYEEIAHNIQLSEIKVKRIYFCDFNSEIEENYERMAERYGFDVFRECVALLEYEDSYFYLGFLLVEANEQYAIFDHNVYYSGVESYGYVTPENIANFSKSGTDFYDVEVIYKN